MKVRTVLLTLSLMTNVLTASEVTSGQENSSIQKNLLAENQDDVNAFIKFLDAFDYSKFAISFEEKEMKKEESKNDVDNELEAETQDEGSNAQYKDSYVITDTNPTEEQINHFLKFYGEVLKIMFNGIKNGKILENFESNFGGEFLKFNLETMLNNIYSSNFNALNGDFDWEDSSSEKDVVIVRIKDCKNCIKDENLRQEDKAKKDKINDSIKNFLTNVLGEGNLNSDRMQKVIQVLFSPNDFPENDLVKVKSGCVKIAKGEFSGGSDGQSDVEEIKNNKNKDGEKVFSFNLIISAGANENSILSVLAHELGHVLQGMNWEEKHSEKIQEENDCGVELMSQYFEFLSYVLAAKENDNNEKSCYDSLNFRFCQFWEEILKLKYFYEFRKDTGGAVFTLSFYGVSFVIAINRAVEFYKNKRSKTDIINELLDLTNNDKLDLKNLDFNFLNEELNQFETSFREYLDILNKKLENDAKSISKSQTKLAGDVGIMGRIKALVANLIASVKSYFACSCVNRS